MKLLNKDFLIAFANGEEVEYKLKNTSEWFVISSHHSLTTFNNLNAEFRIKPKTVTLTYDVPKPFKPKLDEKYWFVDCNAANYTHNNESYFDNAMISMGAYRTKEEVLKVIEAQKQAVAKLGDLDEK